MQWILLIFALVLSLIAAHELVQPVDKKWTSFKKYKLPPGPNGPPVVGNLLQFWRSRSAGTLGKTFMELQEYGEMTTLHMGSMLYVLLNTNRVTREIIDKRAKITHERPHMPISGTLVSKGMRSVTQPTRIWGELRRMMRPLLNDTWTKKFEAWQDSESIHMLQSYLENPSEWYLHNSRYATGVMYGVIAGERLPKTDEEMQDYRKTTMEFLGTLLSTVVDFFPWLECLPHCLQFWRHRWQVMGDNHHRVFKSWWNPLVAKATNEKSHSSSNDGDNTYWVKDVLLHSNAPFKGNEDEAAYLTNTVISAGGDNPRIALNTCIMASIIHPDAFQKCLQEIESVCNSTTNPESPSSSSPCRLPTVADIPHMPYTCAFIKETLRWRPTVPMVPPHTAAEDFTFEDYIFPKGTNFLLNVPALCRDYPSPDAFMPERWLSSSNHDGNENEYDEGGNNGHDDEKEVSGDPTRLTRDFWGFGGGRRICIGYKAAQTALFLPFARLMLCFDFEKVILFLLSPSSLSLFFPQSSSIHFHIHLLVISSNLIIYLDNRLRRQKSQFLELRSTISRCDTDTEEERGGGKGKQDL